MFRLRVDVNDVGAREAFLYQGVNDALVALDAGAPAQWGHMTAQQMVEHLSWSYEVSTGRRVVRCPIPEAKREAWKQFLFDNRPMMREFRNPALVDGLPALRHEGLAAAIAAARADADAFRRHAASAAPDARHLHPVFGPLSAEEWARAHYKHFIHHLQQFGLVTADP
jgi:oxepin-CoA hydrolase/3-oxo-5,6-dehydrosuberyl-CoA semialdehyde dehydrogenase